MVQAVDHFLGVELSIGVMAATRPFDSQRALGDDDRELVVTSHLAFGRVQGKERIYVLKATLEKNEFKENFTKIVAEDRTPWSACSREIKLQSFALLPELLGNLAARVDEVASQTTRTVETVRALIEVMKQPHAHPRADELVDDRADEAEENANEDPDIVDVPLHELTLSAAPELYKRPRARP